MAKLVSSRYSEAFFDLALQSGLLERFAEDAEFVLSILNAKMAEADHSLGEFLYHPQIFEDDKIKVVEAVLGGKVSGETVGLIVVMIRKQRERELPKVLRQFLEKVEEHNGFARAQLTSAVPLDEERLETIRSILCEKFGKKVVLKTHIDKELIGGFKVLIQGYSFDRTIKKSISELQANLRASN